METSLDESKNKYKVAHWLQEIARSIVSFKISGRTNLGMQKTDKFTEKYLHARESHFSILKTQYLKLVIFKVLVTGGLLSIGGLLVLNQEMNIGQFVAAEIIILIILSFVEKLIKGLEIIYDTVTSLEKLGQVIDKKLERADGKNAIGRMEALTVKMVDVNYSVPEKTVLKNNSMEIPAGNKVLLKSPTGSVRTTLLKIISAISCTIMRFAAFYCCPSGLYKTNK